MQIFEAHNGMYDCRHLPAYARFLIDKHLEEYAREQLALGRKMNIPIMAMLSSRFTEEQILVIATDSSREYLTYLAENRAKEQLVTSMSKWLKDRLEIVGKMEIIAQDITLINYVRGQNLKKFIPLYTQSLADAIAITLEIDTILLGGNTTAVDIYIDILKGKVEEQSNLAEKVIKASPAVTFLFDTINHRQLFVSGNVAEVLGYTTDEIVGLGDSFLLDLTHPEDLQGLIQHFQEVIKDNSNRTHQVEYRFKHKNGRYRWLRTYEVIFKRDIAGNPLEILGKTFEITSEKETALALERSEKQLLEAQRIARIGSYEWNIRDSYSKNTEEVFRIFEMTEEQKYEQFMNYLHPDDVAKVKEALAASFKSGYYECEYRYIKNGKEKVVWSIGRVEFKDEQPFRMVGTVQDVTEIKKMEKELVQKSKELAHTNESLRQFAYVASHDMKEPLRKIMMFSDLVLNAEREKLSEKSISQLQKMQLSGKNLYRMVEDILSFSLLEAKETRQMVNLSDVLHQVTELLDETIRQKNGTLRFNALPEAEVIPAQFRQLFQNLLSNSLKFSQKDVPPVIAINAVVTSAPTIEPPEKGDKYVEITISDNGIGFPEEAADKIFELFTRHHSKSEYEGTGLGLSISRRIVDNHGGVIKALPGNPHGATFKIVIPQNKAPN